MIGSLVQDKTITEKSPNKANSLGFIVISICAIAFCCYLARAASIDMFTRVEPCFSECAREMLQSNNFITPLYQGKEFFDKPIFTYWLIALCYKMIGVSVFAARLPSIFSAVLCIGLTAFFARKIYGNFAGILSGAILATSIGFSDMASTAMSDMLLCLFELVSVLALFWGLKDENKRTALFCIASISMGFGFLTKSLIALVFPITTFVILLILCKKLNIIRLKHIFFSVGLFTLIVLPWHIALYKQTGIHALTWMYLHEQIQRFSSNIVEYNFRHPFYYMTVSMLSQLLPWSIFLPIVIWRLVSDLKSKHDNDQIQCTTMLLIFVLLHIIVFSISKSNWGYYNVPALPAASILIGKYISDWFCTERRFISKYRFVIPASIFVGACALSLSSSFFWPTKTKHEAQRSFAQIITNKYPKNQVLIHMDLFAQYFLCDWILFKTEQIPNYYYQTDLVKALDQHKAFSMILPKARFDQFSASLRSKLKVLATEKYKFIPFPLSPLKEEAGTDSKVTLVLATNQINTGYSSMDTYENYEKSILTEQLKANSYIFTKDNVTSSSVAINRSHGKDAIASWWLAKAYFARPNPPDIVVLGNDQLGPVLGADSCVYNRPVDITSNHYSQVLEHDFYGLLNQNWQIFIGALPGAMISDQLVLSRALFSKEYKPKLVAITFSPRDFIDNSFPSATSTEPFAFFAKYADSSSLRSSLDNIRTESYSVKDPFNYYSDFKSYSDISSPIALGEPFERICPGKIVIHSGCDYRLFKDNIDEYKLRYQNSLSPQLDMQMRCFDSLLKYLAQQHIKVVAFNFPISAANRKLLPDDFWKNYNDRISEICRKNEADFISADRVVLPFEENELIDSIHLNLIGGLRWSRSIAIYSANKFHLKTFQELLARGKYLQ